MPPEAQAAAEAAPTTQPTTPTATEAPLEQSANTPSGESAAPAKEAAPSTEPASKTVALADMVSDDYKDLVKTKGWENPEDALKSYKNLEKVVGNPLVKPDENSTETDRKQFYMRLGMPEKAEDYSFDTSGDLSFEGLPEQVVESANEEINHFRKVAHENGLTSDQASNIYKEMFGRNLQDYRNESQQAFEKNKQQEQALRNEWGAAYDERVQTAKYAARLLGGEEIVGAIQKLEESSSSAEVMKLMYAVGSRMAEAKALGTTSGNDSSALTPPEIQAQIDRIEKDPVFLTPSLDREKHATLKAQRSQLYAMKYDK